MKACWSFAMYTYKRSSSALSHLSYIASSFLCSKLSCQHPQGGVTQVGLSAALLYDSLLYPLCCGAKWNEEGCVVCSD